MYLFRKVLYVFGGENTFLHQNFRFQLINAHSVVFKPGKWICAVLLIGIGFFGISCTNTTPDNGHTTLEAIEPQATNEHKVPVMNHIPVKHIVTIKDMKYNPAATQAHIDDTLLFINKDLVPHNVADSLTKEWLSPPLKFGEEWSMIVSKNLHFYCAFHPNMEGDIQLETPLSAQKRK